VAFFTDGHFEYTVLSKADVDNIRTKFSKAPNSPAWQKSYGEMAKKCAIRRLCKTLPLTIETMAAIEADDRRNSVIDVEPLPPAKSGTAALKAVLTGGVKKEAEVIDVEPEPLDPPREREPGEDDDESPEEFFGRESAELEEKFAKAEGGTT
jgi:recombination protein RecT